MENVEAPLFREKGDYTDARFAQMSICIKGGGRARRSEHFSVKRCYTRNMAYANMSQELSSFC